MWRGGLGAPYLFPALSSARASLGSPCSVSTSRSSNRTGGSPASGSRTRLTLSPTESCVSACRDKRDPRLHRDVYPETSRLHVLRTCVSFATIDAASSSRNHLQRDSLYWPKTEVVRPSTHCAIEQGVLSAGPVENLLKRFGPQFIDRVEVTARKDPTFAHMLGGVWPSAISKDVWERLERVCDREGGDE